ncbi:MAG TPA: kynureninase [Steroidobacteraceae bacterium]|jgi:kynureninase|nr:kynureninase [Steroidobacteraceae bacterium]
MNFEATLEFARRADQADPLRGMRARFAMPRDARGAELIYFAGHSLGLLPLAARTLVNEELEDWAKLGVLGHEAARRPWIPYHENLTAGLQQLTGAKASEVIAMNSLTVNIHMMLASFYRPSGARTKVLIEAGAFSSDRHAVASQIAWHGLDPARELIELAPANGADLIAESAIEALLQQRGAEIALVLWPGVQFRTGQSFDIGRLTRAAHAAGCLIGFDLAHSIGNVPLSLHVDGADFAVWCGYKYLNAGPGAIGGAFVHERHVDTRPRLAGWWGHEAASRFAMQPGFRAEHGAAGWAVSNPPVLAAAPLVASLAIFQEAGIERLRAKSVELTGFLEFLLERLAPAVSVISPHVPAARGAQLSLRIAGAGRGARVFERLGAHGVVCDWREPDVIRAAPVPLYNSFEDVFRFAERLAQALQETA